MRTIVLYGSASWHKQDEGFINVNDKMDMWLYKD